MRRPIPIPRSENPLNLLPGIYHAPMLNRCLQKEMPAEEQASRRHSLIYLLQLLLPLQELLPASLVVFLPLQECLVVVFLVEVFDSSVVLAPASVFSSAAKTMPAIRPVRAAAA